MDLYIICSRPNIVCARAITASIKYLSDSIETGFVRGVFDRGNAIDRPLRHKLINRGMIRSLLLILALLIALPAQAQVTLGTSAASPNPQSSFSSTTGLFSSTSGAISFSSSGTEVARVNSSGIGVGTTSPTWPVDVYTAVDTGFGLAGEEIRTSSFEAGLLLNNAGTGGLKYNIFSSGNGSGVGNGNLVFADVTHGAARITISSGGNVGVATTSPDALLSLGGQAAQKIDMVRETTASTAGNNLTVQAGGATSGGTNLNGGTLNLTSGTSTGSGNSAINLNVYESGSSGTSDNSATTAMTIAGNGRVGIGSSSPTSSLDLSQKTDAVALPVGTTGQEPASPVNGMIRYNSTTGLIEAYYNGQWNSLSSSTGFTSCTQVSSSASISASASCSTGYTMTGGGMSGTGCSTAATTTSYPSASNTWTVSNSGCSSVTAYAICCH